MRWECDARPACGSNFLQDQACVPRCCRFEGSIVTETAASDYGPNSADAPTTPSTAAGLKGAARPATVVAGVPAAPISPRVPVTVAAEPPPHEEHVSTAKAVLPTEVAAVAEDEEEKQASCWRRGRCRQPCCCPGSRYKLKWQAWWW